MPPYIKSGEGARLLKLKLVNLRPANQRIANLKLDNLKIANLKLDNLRIANLKLANLKFADLKLVNLKPVNLKLFIVLSLLISTSLGASQPTNALSSEGALNEDYFGTAMNSDTAVIDRFEGPGVLTVISCMDGYAVIDKYACGQVFGILLLENGTEINVSGQHLLKHGLMEGDMVKVLGNDKYRIKSPGKPDDSIELGLGEVPELEIDRLAPRTVVPIDRVRDSISSPGQKALIIPESTWPR